MVEEGLWVDDDEGDAQLLEFRGAAGAAVAATDDKDLDKAMCGEKNRIGD